MIEVSHVASREKVATRLRVFLADDHCIVREGLKTLINAEADLQIVGEAADGNTALSLVRTLEPDVVVMDISMPGLSGLETTARLHERLPHVKVLVLSMHEDCSYVRGVLEAGASGYVLKRSAAEELIRAIRAVAAGGVYLDPTLNRLLVTSLLQNGGSRSTIKGEIDGMALSERESEVLQLVAQGFANKEVAVRLAIGIKSVETYKARAMKKLGLDSRAEVIQYALGRGWLGLHSH